jgi:hypothetical protein
MQQQENEVTGHLRTCFDIRFRDVKGAMGGLSALVLGPFGYEHWLTSSQWHRFSKHVPRGWIVILRSWMADDD